MGEGLSVIGSLKWAWDNFPEIKERLRGVTAWFRKPVDSQSPGILIVGPGGVGKSTLARILAGEHDYLVNPPGEYVESLAVENYSLDKDSKIQVIVPPGQQHRRDATWSDLEADIVAGKFRGVIQILCYGYHSLGQISFEQHRLWKGNLEEFLRNYLDDRRNDEIAVFERISDSIRLAKNKMWLLTVVTKEDLWCKQRAECHSHYTTGKFGTLLNSLSEKKQAQNFRLETVFGSLVISNFKTGLNELMQSNTQGYDHDLQVRSLRSLIETIDSLKNWE